MVLHSTMVKKLGILAGIIGIALILFASILFIPTQDVSIIIPFIGAILFGVILGYVVNVGVYFIMIGVAIWIVGAAIEYRANKTGAIEDSTGEKQ